MMKNFLFLLSIISCSLSFSMKPEEQPISMKGYGFQVDNYGVLEETVNLFSDQLKRDQRVLEIGAGFGRFSLKLANTSESTFYINDINGDNLEKVEETRKQHRAKDRITLVKADAKKIKMQTLKEYFNDETLRFDLIIAANVIHYFSPMEIVEFVANMADLLADQGRMLLIADSDYYPIDKQQVSSMKNIDSLLDSLSNYGAFNSIFKIDNVQICKNTIILNRRNNYLRDHGVTFPGDIKRFNELLSEQQPYTAMSLETLIELGKATSLVTIKAENFSLIPDDHKGLIYTSKEPKSSDSVGVIYVRSPLLFKSNFRELENYKTILRQAMENSENIEKLNKEIEKVDKFPYIIYLNDPENESLNYR